MRRGASQKSSERKIKNGCTLSYREILHKEIFVSDHANIYPYIPYQACPPLQIGEFLNFVSKIF